MMQCSQQENKIQNILQIPSSSVRNQINRTERNVRETRLANQEWAIKNGQFRDIGNIRHTRHRTKTNKAKNTTNHRKLKRCTAWTPPPPQKNPGAHEW